MTSKEGLGLSDLAKIEEVVDHPVELFRIWHDDARRFNPRAPVACCLATTSKDCKVSARNVVLREFDKDGFVIVTDSRSKKVDNLENVPYAAMCFLWFYINEQEQEITKQVKIEGIMKKLEKESYKHLYDREPLFCKIRSHVCNQGRDVNWEELKQRHDEVLDSIRKGENDLPMPDHFVGYKLFPTMMEFYFARDYLIGDRILYQKNKSNDSWENHHIAA
ncbi:pyridoxine/pyridoxamine 5'-phosphate oxidase-like [Frieseomelitta varia]|uniref:pyridoxine/pyridoxamine 5'-phosphate oxidase-like n=1 Tax=Frieseomelitta varia TaxID=561572 RepID=UPI001CB68381|nr:pyridoxine/pyridoxamine 5'-phosphate oxidase-like [Frieseomelitta varia]XP_043511426.1 pyridoxine/pyridoxamine 5'-phosphate oxidase-like [Frieseomelitta varia]